MRNTIRLTAAAVLATLMSLTGLGTAHAADNYLDISIKISVSDDRLIGGLTFDYSVTAPVDCDWTITYEGKEQTGSGKSIKGSYKTKVVSKETPTDLAATCVYENAPSALGVASVDVSAAALATAQDTAVVTLLPRASGTSDNGALPGTGGSSLWIVVLGAGLVLVGGGAVVLARRRSH